MPLSNAKKLITAHLVDDELLADNIYERAVTSYAKDPVAHWKLGKTQVKDATIHQFYDYSGNGNHLSIAGTGYYPLFDGVDDYITVTDTTGIDDLFSGGGTVAATIRPDPGNLGVYMNIMNKQITGAGWYFALVNKSGGLWNLRLLHEYSVTKAWWDTTVRQIDESGFYRVVATFDADSTDNDPVVYINGVEVAMTQQNEGDGVVNTDSSKELVFGVSGSSSNFFIGYIAECVLDDTIWTAGDVLNDHKSRSLSYEDAPAWYKLDESSYVSNVANSSTAGTKAGAGTVTGATATQGRLDVSPTFVSATKTGRAVTFDGATVQGVVNDSTDFDFGDAVNDTPFSVMATVKMTDATNFMIMANGGFDTNKVVWRLWFNATDKLDLILYDTVETTREGMASDAAQTSLEGAWHTVAATYDGRGGATAGNGIILYIDGAAVAATRHGSGTYTAMEANEDVPRMGFWTTGADLYANGDIDEVIVHGRELTAAEIARYHTMVTTGL